MTLARVGAIGTVLAFSGAFGLWGFGIVTTSMAAHVLAQEQPAINDELRKESIEREQQHEVRHLQVERRGIKAEIRDAEAAGENAADLLKDLDEINDDLEILKG